MIRLTGGPAEGTYPVKRAPPFLRAVVNTNTGKSDVLDQLKDRPEPAEQISIYQRQGPGGWTVITLSGRGGKRCETYATGEYRHLEDVGGEAFRDTSAWREWCISRTLTPDPTKQEESI